MNPYNNLISTSNYLLPNQQYLDANYPPVILPQSFSSNNFLNHTSNVKTYPENYSSIMMPSVLNFYPWNNGLSTEFRMINNHQLPNNHINSEGTLVFSASEEIADVSMVDDLQCKNLPELNKNINTTNEQEYWRSTKDCDYRLSNANQINNVYNENISSETKNEIAEVTFKKSLHCKKSRKKVKRLKKQKEGINLKYNDESDIDNDIDLENIDNVDFEKLISYYYKLKGELTILDAEKSNEIEKEISLVSDGSELIDNSNDIQNDERQVEPAISDNEKYANKQDENISLNKTSDNENILESESLPIAHSNETESENIDQSTTARPLDENLLREQLLRSLLEKRILNKQVNGESNLKSDLPSTKNDFLKSNDSSQFKLIIKLSDSDEYTDSDDSNNNEERNIDPSINNLFENQQKEYQKRELININSLQHFYLKWKKAVKLMELKKKRIRLFNSQMSKLANKCKKSQAIITKLRRLYLNEQNNYKNNLIKIQNINNKLKNTQQSIAGDQELVQQHQNSFLNIGQKIFGNECSLNDIVDRLNTKDNGLDVSNNRLKKLKSIMKSLLTNSYTSNTVILLQSYVNFNFGIFEYSKFFQTTKLTFSEFASNSCESFFNVNRKIEMKNFSNENYQSVLEHFNSYRFFSFINRVDILSDFWSNRLNPNEIICHYDLTGTCKDDKCQFQHQKDYILNQMEKILDVLTYSHMFGEKIKKLNDFKNPKLLLEKAKEYLQSENLNLNEKFETIQEKLIQIIRNQSKILTTSLWIRSFPKEFTRLSDNKFLFEHEKIPFDDYIYKFDLRDGIFNFKLSQFVNIPLENDPDLYIKNRFFAPEGVPITAQLESSLASDPHNIQMWINLAYYHLNKIFNEDDLTCFDSSLNVLSRALELNSKSSELYEHYLLIYNKKYEFMPASESSKMIEITELCRRILKHCSTYHLWILYLNLCQSIEQKKLVIMEILENYVQNKISYSNDEERSLNLLEIIFYKIHLLLHLNQRKELIEFFNNIFNKSVVSLKLDDICSLILSKHRVFAWHCYIHFIIYNNLPIHCFQLTKGQCFIRLINTDPFLFDWNILDSDLKIIKNILKRAIKNCCSEDILRCYCQSNNSINTCFSLRLNLTNLNNTLFKNATEPIDEDNDEENLYNLILQNKNCRIVIDLHIMKIFSMNLNIEKDGIDFSNNEMLTLIETFNNSNNEDRLIEKNVELPEDFFMLLECQLKLNYWLAFYYYKLKNINKSKELFRKTLSYYFDSLSDVEILFDDIRLIQLYEYILFKSSEKNELFPDETKLNLKLKFKNDKRAHFAYFYLSYL